MEQTKIYKTIILALVVIILVGGYLFFEQSTTIGEQRNKIDNLTSKIVSNTANIELQTKCAQQAKVFFDYFARDSANDGFSNHYNAKLNKCFVLVTHGITNVNDIYTENIFDAIEKKQYGSYAWRSREGKYFWEVPPIDCSIYPDGNENNTQVCRSQQEFDSLISNYMAE